MKNIKLRNHCNRLVLLFVLLLFICGNQRSLTEEPKPPTQNAGLSSQEKSEVDDLVKKYFESKTDAEKQSLLEDMTKYDDHISKSNINVLAAAIWPLIKKGSKQDGKSPTKCTHPDYPGEYIIVVPPAAKGGAKSGIFIGLHGGGRGKGEGSEMQVMWGVPNPKLITVYPTVIQSENVAWNSEREEQYVLAIIAELKRSYNIDTNQIYLAGISMGGYGAWSIGGHYADVFAALSSGAGAPFIQQGEIPMAVNLKNTPIWFYHSTADKAVPADEDQAAAKLLKELKEKYGPYDFVYKEYTGMPHGPPKEGFKPIWDWMFTKKRTPYPKIVNWEPTRSYKKIFYWLKIDNPREGQMVEAKIDGNKISLQTSNVGVLTIFLNDKLVNLSKPVVIEVNGTEKFNGLASYSLSALVETIDDKKDPEMYYTSRIKIP